MLAACTLYLLSGFLSLHLRVAGCQSASHNSYQFFRRLQTHGLSVVETSVHCVFHCFSQIRIVSIRTSGESWSEALPTRHRVSPRLLIVKRDNHQIDVCSDMCLLYAQPPLKYNLDWVIEVFRLPASA